MVIIDDMNWGPGPMYEPGPNDRIVNPNITHESFMKCSQGVGWKTSVQRFGLNELSNMVNIIDSVEDKTYNLGKPYEFTLNERGHKRYIKALTILDRVLQRSFNDNVLTPAITNKLIYDNGASQKGKGLSFSRARFKYHLQQAYYEYGYSGFILLIDFSKYFDNILHEYILSQLQPYMNQDEFWFLEQTYSTFDIDVSYMSDEEFLNYKDQVFNMLEYHNIDTSLLTGEKIMHKSVGIGNQTSQASGIFYPHKIDNYCKIVRGIKYYGRYMDDTYIIAQTKEELMDIFNNIVLICNELGIHINQKKTRIQPLYTQITYLKINYKILETGRVLSIVPSTIFDREKSRIIKHKKMLDECRMSFIDILQCFVSWRGSYNKFDSCAKVYGIEMFFKYVFGIKEDVNLDDLYANERLQLYNEEHSDIYLSDI